MIRLLKVKNFKSIRDLSLSLGRLNVFIGANACGKTNLVDSLGFLRDCVVENVEVALNRRGGPGEVIYRLPGQRKGSFPPLEIYVEMDFTDKPVGFQEFGLVDDLQFSWFSYQLTIRANRVKRIWIDKEVLKGRYRSVPSGNKAVAEEEKHGTVFERKEASVTLGETSLESLKGERLKIPKANQNLPFLGSWFPGAGLILRQIMENWRHHDIDVRQARQPHLQERTRHLSTTGDNLALVLQQLEKPQTKDGVAWRETILRAMQQSVPGFVGFRTTSLYDGRTGFQVLESHTSGAFNPGAISDGTIRLLGLYTAAIFRAQDRGLLVFEEPEKSIHPLLLEQIVDLLRDASERVQVLVTTHSSQLVSFLEPEETYLMDKPGGETHAKKAETVEHIQKFLEQFSLGELWMQGEIGGVPE